MIEEVAKKVQSLDALLKSYGEFAVAFSGGVDSTFLIWRAKEVLGESALAVTVDAPFYPRRELAESKQLAFELGVRQVIINADPFSSEEVASNPPLRCYHCKKILFGEIISAAKAKGRKIIVDGSNSDDIDQHRPGVRALDELSVKSPLKECGLSKGEIRYALKEEGIFNWNKPSQSCLATRFPYNTRLTPENIRRVEEAEEHLLALGLSQVRLRAHGDIGRLEIFTDDIEKAAGALREEVINIVRSAGFSYVALDLAGYRFGAMDEPL